MPAKVSASIIDFLVDGLSDLLIHSPHFLGNMDPAGLGPLANIQCWHLKSRVGPGGVVPSKRLGHDLVGVEQSPEKLVLLELCVLDLSSVSCPLGS